MEIARVRPIEVDAGRIAKVWPPISDEKQGDTILSIERAGYSLVPVRGQEPFTHRLALASETAELAYSDYLAVMKHAGQK